MTTKIRKWGNSYGVRITKKEVHDLGMRDGSTVEVKLKPVHKKYNLDEMIAQMTPENSYSETDWGKPVGNEVW